MYTSVQYNILCWRQAVTSKIKDFKVQSEHRKIALVCIEDDGEQDAHKTVTRKLFRIGNLNTKEQVWW
jgi:hypothetical protein